MMKILFFSFEGIGFAVAKKLQEEGNEVLVGQVQSYAELGIDKEEDPEDTKKRLATFDGLIEKIPAEELLAKAKKFDNKDEWSVICDFNNLYVVGDKLKKMGFASDTSNGFIFLPTKEQHDLESDRDSAKDFVKKHYQIEVGEVHDFKTTDEGIRFLNDTVKDERIWVLKAYSDDLNAIVPSSDEPMLAKDELISALVSDRAGYESMGYLLEEKISDPQELTPQCVFYDGEPVFYDLDIESKPLFAGDSGPQTGCAQNMVVQISEYDEIVDIAFPPIVYDMAQQHRGLFVWDASILVDKRTGKRYFGEFCSNRWGWDSFFTELAMCESVTSYFESILEGMNPLQQQYGVSVRMFNVKKNTDMPVLLKDDLENIWLYDVHKIKKDIASIGYSWDLLVVTGAGGDLDEAIDSCYERLRDVAFTGGGYRPKHDFLSEDYTTAILSRYNDNVGYLFSGERYEGIGTDERIRRVEREMQKLLKDKTSEEQTHKRDMQSLRDEMLAALNDDQEG